MGSYNLIRDGDAYDDCMKDIEFVKWLNEFEPDHKSEFWQRNVVAMYHAFKAGYSLALSNGRYCLLESNLETNFV